MYRYWSTVSLLTHCLIGSTTGSSLKLYSDSSCQVLVSTINGSEVCTQIPQVFSSFQADSVRSGCAVTVYGTENAFCGLDDKWEVSGCHANTSISQFTIDCPVTARVSTLVKTTSSTTSSTLSTVVTSFPSTGPHTMSSVDDLSQTTSATQQSKASSSPSFGSNLSSEDKIALGVGIPSGLAALITIILGFTASLKWYSNRKKRNKTGGQTEP